MALQKNQLTAIIPAHPMGEVQRTQFRDLLLFAANERICQQSCHLQSELQRSLLMAKRLIDAEGPGAILETLWEERSRGSAGVRSKHELSVDKSQNHSSARLSDNEIYLLLKPMNLSLIRISMDMYSSRRRQEVETVSYWKLTNASMRNVISNNNQSNRGCGD